MNRRLSIATLALAAALLAAACSSDEMPAAEPATTTIAGVTTTAAAAEPTTTTTPVPETTIAEAEPETVSSTFIAEVWADNWFSLTVNGEFVGEDSVPITTERSFNAETLAFEATYPLTIAIEAKDFKETDSGIEYIGANNQQMGDGGLILQITDEATGDVVVVSSGDWQTLVIHEAPLNKECEKSADPDTECQSRIIDAPAGWTDVGFDDSTWTSASVWTAADVGPKDGYDRIDWVPSAQLIWGADLESDNTVLARITVGG